MPFKHTAYYSIIIRFRSLSANVSFRSSSVELSVDKIIVNFNSGSNAVNHYSDGISVAFAEKSNL